FSLVHPDQANHSHSGNSHILDQQTTFSSAIESLLSPPLNIQLICTTPAKSYEEVQQSLPTCLNHLYKIRDEVNFLRDRRRKHTNKKQKTEHSKRRQKSKSSTKPVVS
ncbi:hypothetical protein PSHT_10246, partial [Puccinia striiformis]